MGPQSAHGSRLLPLELGITREELLHSVLFHGRMRCVHHVGGRGSTFTPFRTKFVLQYGIDTVGGGAVYLRSREQGGKPGGRATGVQP